MKVIMLVIMVVLLLMASMGSAEKVEGVPYCCFHDPDCCERYLKGLNAKP